MHLHSRDHVGIIRLEKSLGRTALAVQMFQFVIIILGEYCILVAVEVFLIG